MVFFILIFAVSVNSKFLLVHLIPDQNELNSNKAIVYNGADNLKGDDDDMYQAEKDTQDQDYQGYDAYFGNYCSLCSHFYLV